MEGSDKIYALAHLNPRPEHRYLLNMSLGEEYGWFACIGEDKTLLPYRELNRGWSSR